MKGLTSGALSVGAGEGGSGRGWWRTGNLADEVRVRDGCFYIVSAWAYFFE